VVLVRKGGMGDLICLLASIGGLRARHPNSWLVVITPLGCWQLVASSGLADASADAWSLFHIFVSIVRSPDSYYVPLLPHERDPVEPQTNHLSDDFAEALRVRADPFSVNFRLPERVRKRVVGKLRRINPDGRPIVVLHAKAGEPIREWPPLRCDELCQLISSQTSAVVITIGMNGGGAAQRRAVPPLPNIVGWVGRLQVIELVALLERASAFVGVDSGPLHIAGILGVPSVALFGATSSELRLHPNARAATVTAGVPCLGCHHGPAGPLHWVIGCPNDIACMSEIKAEDVFARLAECLADRCADGGQPMRRPSARGSALRGDAIPGLPLPANT
jgi:ADP-heptose:LPS heptosyltransferase